jgi:hydrogenase maturation protein HypF
VEIEVEGAPDDIDALTERLAREAPPLARIDSVSADEVPIQHAETFEIVESAPTSGRSWPPPDVGLCQSCRDELRDRGNRRFRHPFITCTDCGPRYTIIRGLPYDRSRTTMAAFGMCDRCQAEYDAPDGRRFHAEPVACLECGPTVWLEASRGRDEPRLDGEAALAGAVERLASGGIVAVKGVGGFHLMCDAANPEAVDELRRRKARPHKPFAIVVADLGRVQRVGTPSAQASRDLAAPARPIVLVAVRDGCDLAYPVAPGLRQIGVMLPHRRWPAVPCWR